MNERIRELAEQCYEENSTQIDVEKFAELIVQSILNSLESEREFYANPVTYQFLEYYTKMSAKEDALNDAISLIRSDFGVKE